MMEGKIIFSKTKNFIIYLLTILFVVQPLLLVLPGKASADDSGGSGTTSEDNEVASDSTDKSATTDTTSDSEDDVNSSQAETSKYPADPFTKMASEVSNIIYPETNGSIFTLDEQVAGVASAEIILSRSDYASIKALQYIGANIPDFENDMHELWNNLPADSRPASEDELLKAKFENPDQFKKYISTANTNWVKSENGQKLRNIKALSLVTGLSEGAISDLSETDRQILYDSMMDSLKLDIRVIKTLVYLVTPKDQGGAGHWRIKVRKIKQFSGLPLSTESDSVLLSNAGASESSSKDCDGLTAAECGQQLPDSTGNSSGTGSTGTGSTDSGSDFTVTDKGGDQWEGYLNGIDTEQDPLKQRNISSHSTGQAIDISQVDDIRCTLIKRRRVTKDSFIPQPASPIKLSWQTTEGYSASGGNPIDTMGVIKAGLTDDVRDLVASLGGDVSTYEGDLSNANLSDVIGIVGKSMFAQILNSPSHNLSGYDASDTLKNLGGMYFADYFGLPREVFINRDFNSLDDIQEIIGEAAIEKRMGLPYGSLNSKNVLETAAYSDIHDIDPTIKGKTVYNLEGTFLNIAQRKLEYEMNLNTGDLDTYISQNDLSSNQNLDLLIGKRVIEKELNLKKETFSGANMAAIKAAIGDLKYGLMFKDPTYLDNLLHLDPGTSRKLLSGETSPYTYAAAVGATRKTDTINGLRYFAANDAAYNLPSGTWEGMMTGKRSSFVTAGSFTLGRLIADSEGFSKYLDQTPEIKAEIDAGDITVKATPDDLGIAAMQQWLSTNLQNSIKSNANACIKPENITVPVNVKVEFKKNRDGLGSGSIVVPSNYEKVIDVKLGEDKALQYGLEQDDLFSMLGCAESNTKITFERIGGKILFYGIANKLLSEDQKAKINLLDTDPQFKTDNPEILFYLSRLTLIQNTSKKIKSNWSKDALNDPILEAIKTQINEICDLINGKSIDLLDTKASKTFVRDFLQRVSRLKILLEQETREFPDKLHLINTTILDINALLKAASEILAGKVIPSSDSISINQISTDVLNGTGSTAGGASDTSSAFKKGANVRMLFDLLARRIDVVEFFKKLGCSRAETELGLPTNSLFYLIENYEKNGINGVDAFYTAIGQAQIEDTFNMPNFYFQGNDITANVPDFANNYAKLYEYAKADIDLYKIYLSTGAPAILVMDNDTFLKMTKVSFPEGFRTFVSSAKTYWRYLEQSQKNVNNGLSIVENSLDDVVKNINKNNLGDGIRSGDKDLLFRLGISNTTLSNIATGNIDSTTNKRLLQIDKQLGLRDGTTKALFMKQRPKLANGTDLLTADEKKQIEASADIRVNTLEVYLKLINGDIKLSDLKDQGMDPEYNVSNPYAKQGNESSCPINFVLIPGSGTKGDFVINETFLEDNSFCINDKNGRHCFQTRDEANRYQTEHQADKFENVLDSIAASLAALIMSKDSPDYSKKVSDTKTKLINMINGQNDSVFTDSEYEAIDFANAQKVGTGDAAVSVDLIKKIFSKGNIQSPLIDYKKAVGKVTAARVLSNKLFQGLGFRIDSSMIDSGLFYEILNGNFSAIYELGAAMIEQFVGEKAGTLRAIIRAANINSLNCTLSQAGSSMLGGLLGLNSVSIKGNFINNVGQSMVEETLQLPTGTFFGDSIYGTIVRARPINFALSFKIPMGTTNPITNGSLIKQSDLVTILGQDVANQIKDSSDQYKLERIRDALTGNPTVSESARASINSIELALYDYIPKVFANFSGKLAEEPAGGLNSSNNNLRPYYDEVKKFNNLLIFMDSKFSLHSNTTAKLFQTTNASGAVALSPDDYKKEVGQNKVLEFGLDTLAQSLGLSDQTIDAAKDVIKNIKPILTCQSMDQYGDCTDKKYQDYGSLYTLFSQIFKIDLDSKANFTPGTFERAFSEPKHAFSIFLGEEAKKLDQKLGIDSSKETSFYALYERFNNITENREDLDDNCKMGNTQALNDEKQKYLDILNNEDSDEAAKADATANLTRINSEISSNNAAIEACRKANRTDVRKDEKYDYMGGFVSWLKLNISQYIQSRIAGTMPDKACDGSAICINMPLYDIEQLVFEGNITYLEIAVTAMTINYITNSVDGKVAVPASMRISYEDIKNAYFADKTSLNAAINYATWAAENDQAYDSNANGYGWGDLCPTAGTLLSSLVSCTDNPNGSVSKTGSSASDGMNGTMANAYGCTVKNSDGTTTNNCANLPANYGETKHNEAYQAQQQAEADFQAAQNAVAAACNGNDPDACSTAQGNLEAARQKMNAAQQSFALLEYNQQTAVRNVKKAFQDALQYRLMDQMLWKLDKNVFAGFSRALMKGDAAAKRSALARYLKNGLISGNIFGVKFDGVENLDMWLSTIRLVIDGHYDFNTFVSSGYFDKLSGYIGERFQKWFNFSITPDMAKGLLMGVATGHWGELGNQSDTRTYGCNASGKNCTNIPTFLGAATNWAEGRIFNWADKHMGLPAGTSFGWFTQGRKIYEATKTFNKINRLVSYIFSGPFSSATSSDIAKLMDVLPDGLKKDILSISGGTDFSKLTDKQQGAIRDKIKEAKTTAIESAIVALAIEVVLTFVHKWIGNSLSGFEASLGLVPGSTMVLIDAGVTYGLTAAAHAMGIGGAASLSTLYLAVAIFIAINLTGVYKIELKCNADGYYYHRENPQPSVVDVSDLGVWDGMDAAVNQSMSIKAAQYKARRLIQDMLTMNENPLFADVFPSQIMTGRQEDATALEDSIQTNICDKLGTEVKNGICDGTLAGVWANPQTVAWTHIGF